MIENLIRQYGKLADIPEEELAAAGYERRVVDGTIRISRKGSESKALFSLSEEVADLYGVPRDKMPNTLSPQYLQRMRKVMHTLKQELDEQERICSASTPGSLAPEVSAFIKDWKSYVGSWARDATGQSIKRRKDMKAFSKVLRSQGVKPEVWFNGIEPWYVDMQTREVAPQSQRNGQNISEFQHALHSFTEQELRNGKACLTEVASRVGAKRPSIQEIVEAIGSDNEKLRLALAACVNRGSRKDALQSESAVGFFHLQRLQKALSTRSTDGGGAYEIRLASKNPFTVLDIGNDGGCCIGVYLDSDKNEFAGAIGQRFMPRYLLDPATQFVEILRGNRRCGMALLFAAIDVDDCAVMVINSIELNNALEEVADPIVDAIVDWVITFSRAAGFKDLFMGNHEYNTGVFRGTKVRLGEAETEGLVKDLSWRSEMNWRSHFYQVHGDVLDPGSPEQSIHGVSRVLTDMVKPRSFFDEMRDIFEVVVGPEEYQAEGLAIQPEDLKFVDDWEYRDDVSKKVNHLRQVFGITENEKIPAICLLCPVDLEVNALFRTQKSRAYIWGDLLVDGQEVISRHIRKEGILNLKIDIASLEPITFNKKQVASSYKRDPSYHRDYDSRVQVLLWAHHLGLKVSNRVETCKLWPKEKKVGIKFYDGKVQLCPAVQDPSEYIMYSL